MFLSNIGIPFKVDVGSKYQDISLSGKYIIQNIENKSNCTSSSLQKMFIDEFTEKLIERTVLLC